MEAKVEDIVKVYHHDKLIFFFVHALSCIDLAKQDGIPHSSAAN